ncbi:hypothetical protein K2173_010641 [Erythroxylum novogranatense]|uniref:C2H2-type domain-containing protein n=1 Tax=Erythroxylum novogranatense TaxID=1862640 RepID=A0AAV8TGI5_9ROSI|nr:hypothetical protein K2173_010641 [Erythroxylum novogranatense]
MTNNNTNSDPDFCFPQSSSVLTPYHLQNPRKKRTQLIKIGAHLVPSTSVTDTTITIRKPKYYGKKPDPSAPKITRPCTECGKKFWSWKALFGHMRCHPERQWRGINPPPNYRRPLSPIQKLTSIEAVMGEDDHEVAACLLMLANSADGATMFDADQQTGGIGTVTGNCQVLEEEEEGNSRFECSSCKKVFGSHQALGGHRASHKNVKGCFAITRSNDGWCEAVEDDSGSGDVVMRENMEEESGNNKMVMVLGGHHQCSICLKVFSSGQALGGHKRCHFEKGEEASSSSMFQGDIVASNNKGLDLNLPAPVEDDDALSSCLTLDLRLGL